MPLSIIAQMGRLRHREALSSQAASFSPGPNTQPGKSSGRKQASSPPPCVGNKPSVIELSVIGVIGAGTALGTQKAPTKQLLN